MSTLERVRTRSALGRLEDLAVEAAGDAVDLCVSHLASPDRARRWPTARTGWPTTSRAAVWTGELGAVLGAHVGPGMVALCVAARLPTDR